MTLRPVLKDVFQKLVPPRRLTSDGFGDQLFNNGIIAPKKRLFKNYFKKSEIYSTGTIEFDKDDKALRTRQHPSLKHKARSEKRSVPYGGEIRKAL